MKSKQLPPQIRQAVNRLAHRLALTAETTIRTRLTEQAHIAARADLSLGWRALTDTELEEMADNALASMTGHGCG